MSKILSDLYSVINQIKEENKTLEDTYKRGFREGHIEAKREFLNNEPPLDIKFLINNLKSLKNHLDAIHAHLMFAGSSIKDNPSADGTTGGSSEHKGSTSSIHSLCCNPPPFVLTNYEDDTDE